MKKCKECKEEKSKTLFSKHPTSKDKLQYICKECDKKRWKTKIGLVSKIYINQKRTSKLRGHLPPKYSKKELIEWCLKDTTYIILYDKWVESNYRKDLSPSIDRLDDYEGYNFNNIRVCTWEENLKKHHIDRKNGINNKISKAVSQICVETGSVISIFNSVRLAARTFNVSHSSIRACCKGKLKTVKGYIWKLV